MEDLCVLYADLESDHAGLVGGVCDHGRGGVAAVYERLYADDDVCGYAVYSVWQVPVAITFVYGIVMMYMNYRECFDGPYPFFRVNHQSRLATVLWMAGLTGMITVIALSVRWIA